MNLVNWSGAAVLEGIINVIKKGQEATSISKEQEEEQSQLC